MSEVAHELKAGVLVNLPLRVSIGRLLGLPAWYVLFGALSTGGPDVRSTRLGIGGCFASPSGTACIARRDTGANIRPCRIRVCPVSHSGRAGVTVHQWRNLVSEVARSTEEGYGFDFEVEGARSVLKVWYIGRTKTLTAEGAPSSLVVHSLCLWFAKHTKSSGLSL